MGNTTKKTREITLIELHDILGARIKMTLRDDLTPEQREIENEQSKIIMELGKQIINNADIIMRNEALKARNKSLTHSVMDELIGDYLCMDILQMNRCGGFLIILKEKTGRKLQKSIIRISHQT